MRYLVTGGAGFIGSHLVDTLLRRGDSVTVLDDLSTGSALNLPRRKGIRRIYARAGDVNRLRLRDLDGIFHLGMPSSSPMYRERPELVGRTVSEAVSLLEFARRNDCKVVVASTSSLYSGNDPPHREDMPIHVTDWYTEARYYVERLAQLYLNLHGMRTCCLRLFLVYGPKEEGKGRYANLVSQFIWAARRGEGPVIYGDGGQTRDFVYVGDVVEAFLRAMDSNTAGVFNVGTGVETSFNEVVRMLNEELGTSIKPEYADSPVNNYVFRTCADTGRAEGVLGFSAKVTLREGIRRTAGYCGGRAVGLLPTQCPPPLLRFSWSPMVE